MSIHNIGKIYRINFIILSTVIVIHSILFEQITVANIPIGQDQFKNNIEDNQKFKKRLGKGKYISLDTMPPPRRVLAGNPRVVPYNDFTHQVNHLNSYPIPAKQIILVPGKDSVSEPGINELRIEDYRFDYPGAEPTFAPKMKYGANGYTKHYAKMQGIGGGQMYKIVQDKNKNLWIIDHDLVKFDGSHSIRFTHIENNDKKTTHLRLNDIIVDSKGDLWFLRGSHLIPTNRIIKYDGDSVKVFLAMDRA